MPRRVAYHCKYYDQLVASVLTRLSLTSKPRCVESVALEAGIGSQDAFTLKGLLDEGKVKKAKVFLKSVLTKTSEACHKNVPGFEKEVIPKILQYKGVRLSEEAMNDLLDQLDEANGKNDIESFVHDALLRDKIYGPAKIVLKKDDLATFFRNWMQFNKEQVKAINGGQIPEAFEAILPEYMMSMLTSKKDVTKTAAWSALMRDMGLTIDGSLNVVGIDPEKFRRGFNDMARQVKKMHGYVIREIEQLPASMPASQRAARYLSAELDQLKIFRDSAMLDFKQKCMPYRRYDRTGERHYKTFRESIEAESDEYCQTLFKNVYEVDRMMKQLSTFLSSSTAKYAVELREKYQAEELSSIEAAMDALIAKSA